MSTDWSKYSTPEQTRQRSLRSAPADNAVFSLHVAAVRAIPAQTVEHTPIFGDPEVPDNRAHAEIFGPKNAETRIHYLRIYRVEIGLDSM